jgi:hypothetical protein
MNQLVIPTTLVVAGLFLAGAAGERGAPDAVTVLRDFGFPVYVSLWFMWRLEKRHDLYTARLEKLCEAIAVMVKAIDAMPAGPPGPAGPRGLPGPALGAPERDDEKAAE